MFKRVFAAATAAALLFLAIASVRAREERDTTQTSPHVQEVRDGSAAEETPATTPARYDEDLIKWIPIVVPLFAVMLLVAVYLIDAAVL